MASFCINCGTAHDKDKCPECGEEGTTSIPPSDTPCEYCGTTPTWAVVWGTGSNASTMWLCAACDREEIEYLKREFGVQEILYH